MRLIIPLAITFVSGMIMVLHFFVPHWPINIMGDNLQEWFMIVTAAAIFLGALNLMHVHVRKIKLKLKNWKYSPVTIIGFSVMFVTGLIYGVTVHEHGCSDGLDNVQPACLLCRFRRLPGFPRIQLEGYTSSHIRVHCNARTGADRSHDLG